MTIGRNTNRFKEVIENAQDVRCFSLSNNFSGEPLVANPVVWGGPVVNGRYTEMIAASIPEFLRRELKVRHAKLTATESRYILHVHSNLWYEFTV